jgi:hypothetical protein
LKKGEPLIKRNYDLGRERFCLRTEAITFRENMVFIKRGHEFVLRGRARVVNASWAVLVNGVREHMNVARGRLLVNRSCTRVRERFEALFVNAARKRFVHECSWTPFELFIVQEQFMEAQKRRRIRLLREYLALQCDDEERPLVIQAMTGDLLDLDINCADVGGQLQSGPVVA